jgi:purine-nucleoside phosphorylase
VRHGAHIIAAVDGGERGEPSAAAGYLHARGFAAPDVGVVLGSGLGAFADAVEDARSIDTGELPGYPRSRVEGHAGRLVDGALHGRRVLVFAGRVHYYEGFSLAEVAFPVRVLAALGGRTLILTCAAGGIAERLVPGSLMALSDHLNLMGDSPLRGPNDDAVGPRFPDMSEVYDAGLRGLLHDAARELGITLEEGVYAAFPGPQYETPAEIRMARALGADAVGMSTVPEAIAARHAGVRVAALALITNRAAGLGAGMLSHEEVLEAGRRSAVSVVALLGEAVRRL